MPPGCSRACEPELPQSYFSHSAWCRHLLFSNLLQFPSHCPGPSHIPDAAWLGPMPRPVSIFCPHPFLVTVPASLGHFCASRSMDKSSFFLPISFFAQGQIVRSWKSLPDDWVQWTHQTRFQLSFMGREWSCTHAHRVGTASCWIPRGVYGPVSPAVCVVCQGPHPVCPLGPAPSKRPT